MPPFATSAGQLKAKYPTQPWGSVAGVSARPLMLHLRRGPRDHCQACQEFSLAPYYLPSDVPMTPLTVCTCDHVCECTPG